MSNDTPGQDPVPGWGQPKPEPGPDEATAPWPAEAVPPETPWPAEAAPPEPPATEPAPPAAPWGAPAPAAPAPAAPWGAPAPAPAAPWASTPEPAPVQPAAPVVTPGTWGAPQQPTPQPAPQQPASAPAWGAPPPQQPAPQQPAPQQQPASAPAWGVPPPQQPTPQQQPSAPGAWGAPPPQQPTAWGPPAQQQPPGGWGGPPQQAPGWAPGGPGAPGGPPVGWAPAPAKSGGNGCLKGCLIVGGIGVVLLIIVFIVLTIFAQRFAADLGIGPDGTLTECSIISSSDLSDALKGDAEALPLGGIVDATIGQLLDKRVIPDADDCWIAGENTATGRIARQSGNGSGSFNSARDAAQNGGYFAGDVSGVGDEAFCTGMSEAGSFGILVRRGDTLVYVSLINASITTGSGFETNQDGVTTSPETCDLAGKVAAKVR
ncbi:MAG: hypothetical protein ACYC65_13075 [Candidatus Limnocylindrales bacterium]